MSIFDKLLSPITSIVGSVINKVAGDKIDEKDKLLIKAQIGEELRNSMLKEKQLWYDFTLEFTGSAKDMPRIIQIVRGLIRPIITLVGFGVLIYVTQQFFFNTNMPLNRDAAFAIKIWFGINLVTLTFWFGDKALQRSGLLDLLKSKYTNGGGNGNSS